MTIVHIFAQYPNPYQPYNRKLIERQLRAGIKAIPATFLNRPNFNLNNEKVIHLSPFKNFAWLKFFIYFITHINEILIYKRKNKISFKLAIKICCRLNPIKKLNPDLLHIHHLQLIHDWMLIYLRHNNLKWVTSLRGADITINPFRSEQEYNFITNALRQANGIHCVSESLKKKAVSLGATVDKIKVIKRTVEVEKLTNKIANYKDPDKFNITTIGRFHWKKGYVFALLAMQELKYIGYNFEYHICGSGNSFEETEIKYWINLLGISNEVVLHGFLDSKELDMILSNTHIYLQPSINEGIPNTLLRAIINNIPTVASRVDGIPEVLFDNINGILVNPGKVNEIVAAIIRILSDKVLVNEFLNYENSHVKTDDRIELDNYIKFYGDVINL